jgi:Leucine-rich repeat (LRR) protein
LEAKNIKEGLALLKRTPDGSSYAFSTLTVDEPETPFEVMGDDIKNYTNLLNVSLTKNQFREVDNLAELPYVLNLNISENKIAQIDWMSNMNTMQYLQVMNA